METTNTATKQWCLTEDSPFKEKVYSLWSKQYTRKEIATILSAKYDTVSRTIARGIDAGEVKPQEYYISVPEEKKKKFRMKWDKGLIWEEIE